MKKQLNLLTLGLILIGGLVFLNGCGTTADSPFNGETQLIVQNGEANVLVSVLGTGGWKKFTITSNKAWQVAVVGETPTVDWISIQPMKGNAGSIQFQFKVLENPDDDPRTCQLIFTAGIGDNMKKVIVTLTQDGRIVNFLEFEDGDTDYAEADGESKVIHVLRSTREWTIESSESWLTLNPTEGAPVNVDPYNIDPANALPVTWTAARYEGTSERSATITLRSKGSAVKKTITIIQRAAYVNITDPASKTINVPCGGVKIDATSGNSFQFETNRQWTAVVVLVDDTDKDWVKIAPASGEKGDELKIKFSVDPNPNLTLRTAIIVVSAGDDEDTFTITQGKTGINIPSEYADPNKVALEPYTSFILLEGIFVTNGEPWYAEIFSDPNNVISEIRCKTGNGTGNPEFTDPQALRVAYNYNPTESPRVAVVRIYSGTMEKFITFEQKKAEIFVYLTPGVVYDLSVPHEIPSKATVTDYLAIQTTNREDWTWASDADWAECDPVNLRGFDLANPFATTIKFKANPTAADRTANITITGKDGMTKVFKVKQDGTVFALTPTAAELPSRGGSISFTATTDNGMPITYEYAPVATWYTYQVTATGVDILCESNPGAERTVTITAKCGDITISATLTQKAAGDIAITPSTLTLEANSNDVETADVDYSDNEMTPTWEIISNDSYNDPATGLPEEWLGVSLIHQVDMTLPLGTKDQIRVISLKPNQDDVDRTAVVRITCGDKTAELTVTQVAGTFTVNPLLLSTVKTKFGGISDKEWASYPSGLDHDPWDDQPYTYNHSSLADFVTTNISEVPWTVELVEQSDPLCSDWFTFEKTDQNQFRVEVTKYNDRTVTRTAKFKFTIGTFGYMPEREITFTQLAGEMTLKANTLDFDAYAYRNVIWGPNTTSDVVQINGAFNANGTLNKDFMLRLEDDPTTHNVPNWITVSAIENTIRFDVDPNPSDKVRTANLIVSYGIIPAGELDGRLKKTVAITQKGTELHLSLTSGNGAADAGLSIADPMRIDMRINASLTSEPSKGDRYYITATNQEGGHTVNGVPTNGWSISPADGDWFDIIVFPATKNIPVRDAAFEPGTHENGDIHVAGYEGNNFEDLESDVFALYNIQPNDRERDRVQKFTLTNGLISRELTIRQKAASLVVTNDITIPCTYDNEYIITDPVLECTGADWTVTKNPADTWFILGGDNITGRTGDDIVLRLIQANPTDQKRKATLIIKSGTIEKQLVIYQEAAVFTIANGHEIIDLPVAGAAQIDYNTTGFAYLQNLVTIDNGLGWEIVPANGDYGWFQIAKDADAGESAIQFTAVAANNTDVPRQARVIVKSGEIERTIIVQQGTLDLAFATNSATVEAKATNYVKVTPLLTNDIPFTVGSYTEDWLIVEKDDATSNALEISNVLPNPTDRERRASIPIQYGGQTIIFTVIQKAGELTWTLGDITDLTEFPGGDVFSQLYDNSGNLVTLTTNNEMPVTVALKHEEDKAWVDPELQNYSGNYFTDIEFKANPSHDPRTATLVYTCGEMTVEVQVTQRGSVIDVVYGPAPSVWDATADGTYNHANLPARAAVYSHFGEVTSTLDHNNDWTVDASTEEWINVSRAGDYVVVELTENNTGSMREYSITIRNEGNTESHILVVKQRSN